MSNFAFILRSNLRRHPEQAEAIIQTWLEMIEELGVDCDEGHASSEIAEMLESALGISEAADAFLLEHFGIYRDRS